ncbi:MAG: glycoside hydrolase family 38 C-terminal domain-containing protein [Promethearchaeota archaeon]
MKKEGKIIIVPHTHWDREWYLPFQRFRFNLVKLIDRLLEIMKTKDYRFMLDGQTVVLEDYIEICPENKEKLINEIQRGTIKVGPWYLLPDEWLVDRESIIRNLEVSNDLATNFEIPLMPIGYLPDQFGHTSAIPQVLSDLTNFKAVVLWRGVGLNITSVPFKWKSHENSKASMLGLYLPFGYGNAARFPENYEQFTSSVKSLTDDLKPFSPFNIYLLMNGSDHLFPQEFVQDHVEKARKEGLDISLGSLNEFADEMLKLIEKEKRDIPTYTGEFRSPARAPLLQDTYSARMWIKIWYQKNEDMLVHHAEPLCLYGWFHFNEPYPHGFLNTAWKWHLKNQPHDSICGCSIDRTHEEMKTRFSWTETICDALVESTSNLFKENAVSAEGSSILVFNPANASNVPVFIEFSVPEDLNAKSLKLPDGQHVDLQSLRSKESVLFDVMAGMRTAKLGLKMIPGRKITDFYINKIDYQDGKEPGLLEIKATVDYIPIGEFDVEMWKKKAIEIISSKKYSKFHLIASLPTQNILGTVVKIPRWQFTKLSIDESAPDQQEGVGLIVNKNKIENFFYDLTFNKDGSFKMTCKATGTMYENLHVFEDIGDRGDEYTFSEVKPEKSKLTKIKRMVTIQGPIMSEIKQTGKLVVFKELDSSREKRVGKTSIDIETSFRFYRDLPRIDISTKLRNTTKDHRLRICFNLPFTSKFTKTSTHFGFIKRKGNAEVIPDTKTLEEKHGSYPEKPSGIQAQKRFIRIDNESGKDAFTLMNKGLPEIELVNGNKLALTLLRCIGWLSRSDIPERPMHAGPAEETPGAQELDQSYEFNYSIMVHENSEQMFITAEQADSFAVKTDTIMLYEKKIDESLLSPIIEVENEWIRISSLRMKNNAIMTTLYNFNDETEKTQIKLNKRIKKASVIIIGGATKEELSIKNASMEVIFNPHEIKILKLEKE